MYLVPILYLFVGARFDTPSVRQLADSGLGFDPFGRRELAGFAHLCLCSKSRGHNVDTERQWNSRNPNVSKTTQTDK